MLSWDLRNQRLHACLFGVAPSGGCRVSRPCNIQHLLVSVALFLAFSPKTYCVRLLAVTLPMESGPSSENSATAQPTLQYNNTLVKSKIKFLLNFIYHNYQHVRK